MISSLGFSQPDAQALVGVPVTIAYRDSSGNQKTARAVIKYVTVIGFAAFESGTGNLLLFSYGQVSSVAKESAWNWKEVLIYGGSAAVLIFAFGKVFGAERLWKRKRRK